MNTLIGKLVEIDANDLIEIPLLGTVIAINSDNSKPALKLQRLLFIKEKSFFYAVISVRYENHSLMELIDRKNVHCGVTFVSSERFSDENPLDLSCGEAEMLQLLAS